MGQRIKSIGSLRYKFYTCTETIKAVAKEILMRISNEQNPHTSEAQEQLPEGFLGQGRPKQGGARVTLKMPLWRGDSNRMLWLLQTINRRE